MTYTEYIDSKEWLIKRTEVMANPYYGRHHECFICRKKENLTVHHLTYDRLGNEREDDLIILCGYCHNQTHTVNGVHTNDKQRISNFPFDAKVYILLSKYKKERITWKEKKPKKVSTAVDKKNRIMNRTKLPALLHHSMFAYLNAQKNTFRQYGDPTSAFMEYFEKRRKIHSISLTSSKQKQIQSQYIEYKDQVRKFLDKFFIELRGF